MKLNNETKIGILGLVVVTLLIFGFNFLKGHKMFSRSMTLYATYADIQGLTPSSPVMIKGLQVGTVRDILHDEYMKDMTISLNIQANVKIPSNSVAVIQPNPLTMNRVEIRLGDATTMASDQDTLRSLPSSGFIEGVIDSKVDPVLQSVKTALQSVDSALYQVNEVLNAQNRAHLTRSLANLEDITQSMRQMMDPDQGPLAGTLKHTESLTRNLASNNDKVNRIVDHMQTTSERLSRLDLQQTVRLLDSSIASLKLTLDKLNSKEGTMGLMMNDPTLYRNLTSTSNKINVLLDDLRTHPGRYVQFSMFGKKNKTTPLSVALPDTLNAPYSKQPE